MNIRTIFLLFSLSSTHACLHKAASPETKQKNKDLADMVGKIFEHVEEESFGRYRDRNMREVVEDIFSNGTEDSAEEEQEDDDSEDAFGDIEDEAQCVGGDEEAGVGLQRRLPTAVIIGTRKGGTRALLEFLNMHSSVRRAKHETHFYDKHFHRGLDW